MFLAQLATRQLPASAIHDTVAAIARGIDYRRSLRQSLFDRFFLWISEGMAHLLRFLRHSPVSRPFGYTVIALIVLGVAARLIIAAQARDDERGPLRRRTRASGTEDPFAIAERLAAEGRYEEAAHALYRGVLLALARLLIAAQARDDACGPLRRRTRASGAEDPFVMAERLAAEGKYEEAAHALYRGVLLAMARQERLRLDPSKTSGDYARELRARGSASYQPFRAFGRRFDIAVFGHGVCDARLIEDLRMLAQPLTGRARAA